MQITTRYKSRLSNIFDNNEDKEDITPDGVQRDMAQYYHQQ